MWGLIGRAVLVSVATTIVRVVLTHSFKKKKP
jgi:hypothetical protein